MNKKIVSAIAWAFFSCVFLWLFSLTQIQKLSSPPSEAELFNSFALFSFMLLGGGASYHFLTEIISSPYNRNDLRLWNKLSKNLLIMMGLLISIPVIILICRNYLPNWTGWILSYSYSVISMLIAFWRGTRIKSLFKEISSNTELDSTSGSKRTSAG